jgi:TPR repeat protein
MGAARGVGIKANNSRKDKFMKRVLCALAVVCLLCWGGYAAAFTKADLQKGQAAYDDGKYDTAFQIFTEGAKAGNADALYYLALCYDFGRGADVDHEKAVELYLQAANKGQTEAMYNLAVSYDTGEGVEQDHVKAFGWYVKAAEGGDTDAMYNLAISYYNGEGTAKNIIKAKEWMRKAADAGHEEAKDAMQSMRW